MKTILILATVLFVLPVFAEVNFTPSQQILMRGSSCDELNTHASSILQWTRAISNMPYDLPECLCSSKQCQMDVGPISPYFVKELTNFESGFATDSAYNGPNCFNAALVSSSTLPKINFTHPLEMTAILDSPLCSEIKPTEALVPGDILVVRNSKDPNFEVHAGIYLSDELAFSKYGENSLMPYSYGLNVDKSYGVNDEACRRIYGKPAPGDPCYEKFYVNHFKCGAFSSFISKTLNAPGSLHPSAQKIYAETSSLDLRISNVAYEGYKISAEELLEYQTDLEDLYQKTEIAAQDPTLNANNAALVRLMRFRIFSLFEQTRRIALGIGEKSLVAHELEKPVK